MSNSNATTNDDRVVVVNREACEVVSGRILGDDAGMFIPKSDQLDKRYVAVKKERPIYLADIMDQQIIDKYPDIILADASATYPANDFYGGRIAPEEYITPKYSEGDYVIGVMVPKCSDATFRLVGGTIVSTKIVPEMSCNHYTYKVFYGVQVQTSYSVEQFRRYGAKPATSFQVDKDGANPYYCILNQDFIVVINNICKGDVEDDTYTLYYIMQCLVVAGAAVNFTDKDIFTIINIFLESSYNRIFGAPYNVIAPSTSQTYLEDIDTNTAKYEYPSRHILKNILREVANHFMQAEPDVQKIFAEQVRAAIVHGDIKFMDTIDIPMEKLLNTYTIRKVLIDTSITGINMDAFTEKFLAYIIASFAKRLHYDDGSCGNIIESNNNIIDASRVLFGCIDSPIHVGAAVTLSDHFLLNYGTDPTVADLISANKSGHFKVMTVISEEGLIEITQPGSRITYRTSINSVTMISDDIRELDQRIYAHDLNDILDELNAMHGRYLLTATIPDSTDN